MKGSGKWLLWFLMGILVVLAIICCVYLWNTPEGDKGMLVDSFEYLERAVYW